ncbi:uncharacterized protein LOC125489953 [Plutella xylostella]|uniref:uncharacterized protein LOC125489953 n=1 Tax=Plutella xylostella TaxID=51655 RepID=UPI0020329C49|nr:uncharacterized protein LOC125489953 [Plutella xylostella]
MDSRLTVVCCIVIALAVSVSAAHLEAREQREVMESMEELRQKRDVMESMRQKRDVEESMRQKRDVMDTMKSAWGEVVRTLSDAGDAVVHVFKPTEKSVVDKMADGVKGLVNSS